MGPRRFFGAWLPRPPLDTLTLLVYSIIIRTVSTMVINYYHYRCRVMNYEYVTVFVVG